MPVIHLNQAFGLDVEGSLSSGAKLLEFFPKFNQLADVKLDALRDEDLATGLNLVEPLPVPADGLSLKLSAGASVRFALIGPGAHGLDKDDPFDAIGVPDGELYFAMALRLSGGTKLSGSVAPLTLGFAPEGELELRCYRRFQRGTDGFPALRGALAAAASSFVLPWEVADLRALGPDTVLVLRGEGTLAASADVSAALPTESLASTSLVGGHKFEAQAGASVGVEASLQLAGTYQARLRRLDGQRAELSIYTLKSAETSLGITAEGGLSAAVGTFDLGERVVKALSPKPVVDVDEFRRALPDEDDDAKKARITAFQASIQAGICTKLQASLGAACDALQSHEALWAFEIDTNQAVSDDARAAVADVFRGKLGKLTDDPHTLPAGFALTRNFVTDSGAHKLSLKINVLGLVNLIEVDKLAQFAKVERNRDGDITLMTDTLTENRLQALLSVFGGDGKRLRKLLSENFLITAAYRTKDLGVLPPDFQAKHTYFAIHGSTNREAMKDELDVACAFGWLTQNQVLDRLGGGSDFGRTTLFVETQYAGAAVRDAFLKPGGQPPLEESYAQIGRAGLKKLLEGDAGQPYRWALASDPAVWTAFEKTGNRTQFPGIFGLRADTMDPRLDAAGTDYYAITGWASAMAAASRALAEIDALVGAGPVKADAPNVQQARQLLKKRLEQVVKNTKDEFGEPLGLILFYYAANRNGAACMRVTGPQIQTRKFHGDPAVAAGN